MIWNGRVVVPPQGRSVLSELHFGNPGVSRMKSLAHGLVLGLDKEVEQMVTKLCELSRSSTISSGCTITALELAYQTVVKVAWTMQDQWKER